MLTITIPAAEDQWDPNKREFVSGANEQTLELEHSLLSISKWEEIHEKPFPPLNYEITHEEFTPEEFLSYVKCMTIPSRNQTITEEIYSRLTQENIKEITGYISSSKTATKIYDYTSKSKMQKKGRTITSELIYAWMAMLHIPPKCDKWFLNRLLTLIEVASIESNPESNKMNAREYAAWRKAENARRRAASKAKH